MRSQLVRVVSGLMLVGLLLTGFDVASAAAPPATTFCNLFPDFCKPGPAAVPDLALRVNTFTTRNTPTVVVSPVLRASSSNTVTVRAGYRDDNRLISGDTACVATRYRSRSGVTIAGENGQAIPWDQDNKPSPEKFGHPTPVNVVISNLPQNARTTIDLGVYCVYSGVTYRRNIRIPIDGYNSNATPTVDFNATPLPAIAWDAPASTKRNSLLNWGLFPGKSAVGACAITQLDPKEGSFTQGLDIWGIDSFIKKSSRKTVAFSYPPTPGEKYTYTFSLSCSNAAAPRVVRVVAQRLTPVAGQGSFSITSGSLKVIPYDSPDITYGSAPITWATVGDVGECQITETRNDASYRPSVVTWGAKKFIEGNPRFTQTVAFNYPPKAQAGRTNIYQFTMSCSKVAGSQSVTLRAKRANGSGMPGDVLNFGYGSTRL